MSIQDYFRRGEWMFENIEGVNNIHHNLFIIDVKWIVFRYMLFVPNKIPDIDNVVKYIMDTIEAMDPNITVLSMPTQKTRNCYYGLLEESLRYSTNENYYIQIPNSLFMTELYTKLSELDNSTIKIIKDRYIFNENEEILGFLMSYLQSGEGSIVVFTMSADFFLYSITMDDNIALSKRIYFYNGVKTYNSHSIAEYFKKEGVNLNSREQKSKFFHAAILFGNAYFPVHFECHIYLLINSETQVSVDAIIDGKPQKINKLINNKFMFFLNLVRELTNSEEPIYEYLNTGFIKYNKDFVHNTIHTVMYKLDQNISNTYYPYVDPNIYQNNIGQLSLLLDHWKIPDKNNIFGNYDNFISDVNSGDNIEFYNISLANMLGYVYINTIRVYENFKFNVGDNVYFDSSIYSAYYLNDIPVLYLPINTNREVYDQTMYILRTNSTKYVAQHLTNRIFDQSQYKILSDMSNIHNNENAEFIDRINFINNVHSLNRAGFHTDPFVNANDKHRKIIKVYLPYMPLAMKFMKVQR